MNKKSDLIKSLINNDAAINPKLSKSIDYYKKVSDLIERTDKALGRKREFKQVTQSTIDLKISPNANISTTNF